jgi:hypothetical protein
VDKEQPRRDDEETEVKSWATGATISEAQFCVAALFPDQCQWAALLIRYYSRDATCVAQLTFSGASVGRRKVGRDNLREPVRVEHRAAPQVPLCGVNELVVNDAAHTFRPEKD